MWRSTRRRSTRAISWATSTRRGKIAAWTPRARHGDQSACRWPRCQPTSSSSPAHRRARRAPHGVLALHECRHLLPKKIIAASCRTREVVAEDESGQNGKVWCALLAALLAPAAGGADSPIRLNSLFDDFLAGLRAAAPRASARRRHAALTGIEPLPVASNAIARSRKPS